MYIYVLRNLIVAAENVATKFAFCSTQKLVAKKRAHIRSITSYILPDRTFCTDHKIIENNKGLTMSQNDPEKVLEEMLLNPENEKAKKIVELEIEILRNSNGRVPSNIEAKQWLELLELKSVTKKRRYLEFLWRNEKKRENAKMKKTKKMLEYQERIKDQELQTGTTGYALHNNTLFLRLYTQKMNSFYNGRVIPSILFGPKLVFDLGFEQHMTKLEQSNCARQLVFSFVANRTHHTPFHFYFCNCNPSGIILKSMHRIMPNLYEDEVPIDITTKSYLDIFDKDKLVYLTPNARTELQEFDADMVYIIGGIVDKGVQQPLTFAKAKKEGIKIAKLPLDSHLAWSAGSGKNLTINQCVNILLDVYQHGDWPKALIHVPRRKIKTPEEIKVSGNRKMYRRSFKNHTTTDDSLYNGQVPNLVIRNRRKGKY